MNRRSASDFRYSVGVLRLRALAPLLGLASLACDPGEAPCSTDRDCAAGEVCFRERCVRAGVDAGRPDEDAGSRPDAGDDAGEPPPPTRPVPRWPFNGASTGSVHGSAMVAEPALRPMFDWDDSPGATRYEIQITHECASPGFDSCPFDAPVVDESVAESELRAPPLEVDFGRPVGRRYYWRVRACATACSGWSRVRYLDVGRQPNDFDGDGYAEILSGAYLDDAGLVMDTGRAYWWRGSASGPSTLQQIAPVRRQADARMGLATAALGDVNGDGFADAAIGAYQANVGGANNAGEVYVFYGSVDGLGAAPDLTLAPPLVEPGTQIGRAVAPAGDVNADGFADLLVSAHAQDGGGTNLGRAYVYLGGPGGLAATPAIELAAPDAQDNQQFGFPLTGVGDVDGDGYADVLVGERLWDDAMGMDRGRAHLFAGTADGVSTRAAVTFVDPVPTDGGLFSWGLGPAGDVNGDRFADLWIGGRLSQSSGSASLFVGGASGPTTTPAVTLLGPGMQATSEFGFSVGACDLNADGRPDAVVGARLFDRAETNEGRAYVYYAADGTFPADPSTVLDGAPREAGAQYGYAVSGARDVDGDGVEDLVIGALNQDLGGTNNGAVYFYRGTAGGLDVAPTRLSTTRVNGRLGSSLAIVLPY